MALSEFERSRAQKLLDEFVARRRPPAEIRHEVDLSYEIDGQSIVLFLLRPRWDNPNEILHEMIAKATYIRTRKVWKIYWQRADLRWHGYKPCPEVRDIPDFLRVVEEDPHGCFWG